MDSPVAFESPASFASMAVGRNIFVRFMWCILGVYFEVVKGIRSRQRGHAANPRTARRACFEISMFFCTSTQRSNTSALARIAA